MKLPIKFHWNWPFNFRRCFFKAKREIGQFVVVVVVVDQLRLLYLCRGLPKEASGEVSLYLAH